MEDLYLNLSSILLCGGFVVIVDTVLTLPGALISHSCAGGDKIDTAGPSSLQLVIVPITLPVIFSAHHPLDPVPTDTELCQGNVCNPVRNADSSKEHIC